MKHQYSRLVVFVIIFLLPGYLYSQDIIKGKVIMGSSRQPIEGVTVSLLPANISVITDQAGNFILKK